GTIAATSSCKDHWTSTASRSRPKLPHRPAKSLPISSASTCFPARLRGRLSLHTTMQTSWPGHYYDGRTSTRHAVTVFLTPSGLEISLSDGSRIFWPYHELTQTQGGYEHEPARLERGQTNPASLVVEDPGFLPSMRTIAQREGRQFRGLREFPRGARVIVLAGVASLALLGALMLWGIPALAELVTPRVQGLSPGSLDGRDRRGCLGRRERDRRLRRASRPDLDHSPPQPGGRRGS